MSDKKTIIDKNYLFNYLTQYFKMLKLNQLRKFQVASKVLSYLETFIFYLKELIG